MMTVWKSSLLVIVDDEHGGLYDHGVPPACPSPDGMVCPSPPFDFTRLGPRVPALIISPYVKPGQIDHTIYDHTSAIATAMKLFAPQAWPSDVLGKRAQAEKTLLVPTQNDLNGRVRENPIRSPKRVGATIFDSTEIGSIGDDSVGVGICRDLSPHGGKMYCTDDKGFHVIEITGDI